MDWDTGQFEFQHPGPQEIISMGEFENPIDSLEALLDIEVLPCRFPVPANIRRPPWGHQAGKILLYPEVLYLEVH